MGSFYYCEECDKRLDGDGLDEKDGLWCRECRRWPDLRYDTEDERLEAEFRLASYELARVIALRRSAWVKGKMYEMSIAETKWLAAYRALKGGNDEAE